MARWSKIDRRIWGDQRFRRLSAAAPNAQTLWLRLLTGPELGPIPGLFPCWEAGLAQALGWAIEPFRERFAELLGEGMVMVDWEAGLVWLPNGIKHNPPANPNVVRGWRTAWDELPECALKDEAYQHLKRLVEPLGEGFAKAFRDSLVNRCGNGIGKQEQEQDQEQKQEGEVARAREDHPPPGSDRTNGERAPNEQTAGYLDSIREQGAQDRPPGHQPGQLSNRRPHPRDETYAGGLLNPEAEQIHELLLAHHLPLNSLVGMANHIAGLLGPFGNNKLTVARVKLAIEAVARKSAAAAADLAPRSADEVRDHLLTFLRYSDVRWKTLEQKLAAEAAGPGPAPDAPPYHHPVPEPELPPGFKAVPMPAEFKAQIAKFGVRPPPRKRTTAGGEP